MCAQNIDTSNGCTIIINASTMCLVPGGAAVVHSRQRVATRADKCFDTIALMCSAIIDTDTRKRIFITPYKAAFNSFMRSLAYYMEFPFVSETYTVFSLRHRSKLASVTANRYQVSNGNSLNYFA